MRQSVTDWPNDEQRMEMEASAHKRINVGCGEYPLNWFTNIDADPDIPAQIHEVVPPIPFEDGTLEHVWACHFIEHLRHNEAIEFMAECYRVLEPGGKVGVVVPDTREIMTRWLANSPDCFEFPFGTWRNINDLDEICGLFLYSTTQDSEHQWSYDEGTLARLIAGAGFVDLNLLDRYRYPLLGSGQWYQVGIEGRKP